MKQVFSWFLFFFGLSVMSLGISIVTLADLGTTPISALPFVASLGLGLSFGEWTLIINLLMVALQFLLLRSKSTWKIILQIPAVFVFSMMIDYWMQTVAGISLNSYISQLAFSLFGNFVMGFGIAVEITSGVLVLPGEGLVLALSIVSTKPFPKVKIANDVGLVLMAVALGFALSGGLMGVREGTLLSAVTVGLFVKFWMFVIKEGKALALRKLPLRKP